MQNSVMRIYTSGGRYKVVGGKIFWGADVIWDLDVTPDINFYNMRFKVREIARKDSTFDFFENGKVIRSLNAYWKLYPEAYRK